MSADTSWLDQPDTSASTAVAVASPTAERAAKLVALWPALSPKQQTILQALQVHNFNSSKVLRILQATNDSVDRKTLWRWINEDEDFKTAYAIVKTQALEAIDPRRTLLRVEEIAEDALRPKDVYFKGAPTGEKRKDYAAALKATELQMKNQKLLGNEDVEKGGFGGRQITLNVQVVLPDGQLKEMKRAEGITIDAPVIEVLP